MRGTSSLIFFPSIKNPAPNYNKTSDKPKLEDFSIKYSTSTIQIYHSCSLWLNNMPMLYRYPIFFIHSLGGGHQGCSLWLNNMPLLYRYHIFFIHSLGGGHQG
jgi:hypothetical protein